MSKCLDHKTKKEHRTAIIMDKRSRYNRMANEEHDEKVRETFYRKPYERYEKYVKEENKNE